MQALLSVIIIILAFPVGYLLAWVAKDELAPGRKWFLLTAGVSVIGSIILAVINFAYKIPSILTLLFIIILCLMAVWKSKDKNWIKIKCYL